MTANKSNEIKNTPARRIKNLAGKCVMCFFVISIFTVHTAHAGNFFNDLLAIFLGPEKVRTLANLRPTKSEMP